MLIFNKRICAMEIVYTFITLLATTIGAIAGFGGGIVIKPCFDAISQYNAATIQVLSSITVLSMSTVSTLNYIKSGVKIKVLTVLLSIGAILGGIIGKYSFEAFSNTVSSDTAKGITAIILALLMISVLFRKYFPKYNVKSKMITICAGLIMGFISAFLGIGGGPVNTIIICTLFSVSVKDGAVYSIFVIFFSQLANVASIAINPGFAGFDLEMLKFMIPAGVAGGFIGSCLNRKMQSKTVEVMFNIVLLSLIALNIFNIYNFLLL